MKACYLDQNTLATYLSSILNDNSLNFALLRSGNVKIKILKIKGTRHSVYNILLSSNHERGKKLTLEFILKFYTNSEIAKREYFTLKTLLNVGFPVPRVYKLEINEKKLGAPFIIMEKIKGKTLQNYIKHLDDKETFKIIKQFAEALVQLHELDIKKMNLEFLDHPKDEYDYAKRQSLKEEGVWVNELLNNHDFKWAIQWLEENAPKVPCYQYSLLHGDMNPKNFIVAANENIFFLDWTWAEIGDRLKDVGYAYHNIRHMFGVRNIDKKGARFATFFLKHYMKKSSQRVDRFASRFYLFSAAFREALYYRYLSNKLKKPSSVVKLFGAKFIPISPLIYWHFRRRYQHLKSFLTQTVPNYERAMFGTFGGKIESMLELKDIIRFLKPSPNQLILDIGTGSGRIAKKSLEQKNLEVVGIDLSRSALTTAKLSAKNYGNRFHAVIADGQFLPFKDHSFDGVICIRTLKYFSDYVRGIAEISRVIKPNKRVVLDLSSIFGYEAILRYVTDSTARGFHLFNFYKMRDLLKRYSLYVTDAIPLQKIPHRIWTLTDNSSIIKFLIAAEFILRKITPMVFSRSVLLNCVKSEER